MGPYSHIWLQTETRKRRLDAGEQNLLEGSRAV